MSESNQAKQSPLISEAASEKTQYVSLPVSLYPYVTGTSVAALKYKDGILMASDMRETVRSCYCESCLLHAVNWMPPKGGVSEEQVLKFMGANTSLSPLQVKQLIEARGKEVLVAGFCHEGYEEPLLVLMKRRAVHSGLVVKGEEGALSMSKRLQSINQKDFL
ncbi:hypothetical protein FNV43_RR18546 [Rhamnella rubrinervis]|uniref:Uncharacterized protein n=1 Tax=Rhamnella rubrinervis TaxID=2594499 RepID=A0A8K0GT13_9ROSA|nr:hypothetical protein FNV43_RR18546 [Rhamnella rubrinervis]